MRAQGPLRQGASAEPQVPPGPEHLLVPQDQTKGGGSLGVVDHSPKTTFVSHAHV